MNLRLLLCILSLISLAAGPSRAQIAAVASPSGPVQAGPYVVVDAVTGATLLERKPGGLLVSGLPPQDDDALYRLRGAESRPPHPGHAGPVLRVCPLDAANQA